MAFRILRVGTEVEEYAYMGGVLRNLKPRKKQRSFVSNWR